MFFVYYERRSNDSKEDKKNVSNESQSISELKKLLWKAKLFAHLKDEAIKPFFHPSISITFFRVEIL